MAIEIVNTTAMTYQGSVTSTGSKSSQEDIIEGAAIGEAAANSVNRYEEATERREVTTEAIQKQESEIIKRAIEQINKMASNSYAQFGYHDDTNRIMIKIVDKDSKRVLKEIPPEKTLDMIAKAWELAGLLVDEKR